MSVSSRASEPVGGPRWPVSACASTCPEVPEGGSVPGFGPRDGPDAAAGCRLKGGGAARQAPLAPSPCGRLGACGGRAGPPMVRRMCPFAAARRLRRAYFGKKMGTSRARSVGRRLRSKSPHEGVTCLAAQDVWPRCCARPIRAAWAEGDVRCWTGDRGGVSRGDRGSGSIAEGQSRVAWATCPPSSAASSAVIVDQAARGPGSAMNGHPLRQTCQRPAAFSVFFRPLAGRVGQQQTTNDLGVAQGVSRRPLGPMAARRRPRWSWARATSPETRENSSCGAPVRRPLAKFAQTSSATVRSRRRVVAVSPPPDANPARGIWWSHPEVVAAARGPVDSIIHQIPSVRPASDHAQPTAP